MSDFSRPESTGPDCWQLEGRNLTHGDTIDVQWPTARESRLRLARKIAEALPDSETGRP